MSDIVSHERLEAVLARLRRAAGGCGRNPAELALVAVSKKHDAEKIVALAHFWHELVQSGDYAGKVIFAENYLQEAVEKQDAVNAALAASGKSEPKIVWHFAGHLQSRKARNFHGRFALLHTLDSLHVAQNLHKEHCKAVENSREHGGLIERQAALIQVNIGGETQKSGIDPDKLFDFISKIKTFASLEVRGLMCLPPYFAEAEESRPYFRKLRQLRDSAEQSAGLALPELSMGMSRDFEVAIQEGATMVRVGTDIFGERI